MNHVALRPEHLDILSICTGGAGLDLGIELAIPGARTVCMVEREAFAAAQLVSAMEAGLMAPAPIWSDATTFDGRRWRGCVDGLIGGIPCQPHSLAGKREGSDDERDLWSTARRIIVQSGAWFVLIENVGGMLSAKPGLDAGALRVRRDLRRLGFDIEGGLFTAAEVGASHERERVFILGVADGDRKYDDGAGFGRERWRRQPSDSRGEVPGVGLADAYRERLEGQRPDAGALGRQDARRPAGLRDGATLVHAERAERRADADRGHEPDRHHSGRHQEASRAREPGALVVDAESLGRGEGWAEPSIRSRRDAFAGANGSMADTDIIELRRKPSAGELALLQRDDASGLFPPGPSDLSGWRHTLERAPELEPAVRRVADGLASRLDISRVDRLRLLGNGVVPLQAAYAIRTLATRLAGRGSTGAARLVRMMGEA